MSHWSIGLVVFFLLLHGPVCFPLSSLRETSGRGRTARRATEHDAAQYGASVIVDRFNCARQQPSNKLSGQGNTYPEKTCLEPAEASGLELPAPMLCVGVCERMGKSASWVFPPCRTGLSWKSRAGSGLTSSRSRDHSGSCVVRGVRISPFILPISAGITCYIA